MTGMRLRDVMLAVGVMVMVIVSVSLQLSLAGQMKTQDAATTGAAATASLIESR